MQRPNVITIFKDEAKDVTYKLIAYRKLSREEAILMIRHAYADKKFKKPKKGETVGIETIIGYND